MQGRSLRRGDSPGEEGRVRHMELQGQTVHSWGPHTFNVGGRLDMSDGVRPDIPRYGLGGFQLLSGYAPFQVSGQQVALLRLGYQMRLSDMALMRGLFFGSSFEVGNAWDRPEDIGRGKKRTGQSIYLGADTALGPVYAAIVNSPVVGPTLMLFVGRP
jgi:NTE family protein